MGKTDREREGRGENAWERQTEREMRKGSECMGKTDREREREGERMHGKYR